MIKNEEIDRMIAQGEILDEDDLIVSSEQFNYIVAQALLEPIMPQTGKVSGDIYTAGQDILRELSMHDGDITLHPETTYGDEVPLEDMLILKGETRIANCGSVREVFSLREGSRRRVSIEDEPHKQAYDSWKDYQNLETAIRNTFSTLTPDQLFTLSHSDNYGRKENRLLRKTKEVMNQRLARVLGVSPKTVNLDYDSTEIRSILQEAESLADPQYEEPPIQQKIRLCPSGKARSTSAEDGWEPAYRDLRIGKGPTGPARKHSGPLRNIVANPYELLAAALAQREVDSIRGRTKGAYEPNLALARVVIENYLKVTLGQGKEYCFGSLVKHVERETYCGFAGPQ